MRLTVTAHAVFALLLLGWHLHAADTSASYDIQNDQQYENCRVWSQVDMFTDEISHHLRCLESSFTDQTSIALTSWSPDRRLVVVLSKGVQFIMDEVVAIAYRIDKGELVQGRWAWEGNNQAAFREFSDSDAAKLLDALASGSRIAVLVHEEKGNVVLMGSHQAVQDFKSRIRALQE